MTQPHDAQPQGQPQTQSQTEEHQPKWKFSVVPGIFQDFRPEDMPDGKVPTQPRLALLHRDYPGAAGAAEPASDDLTRDWPRLAAHVRELNRDAPEGVRYKVLYLTRHGVGFHNQKHTEVGTEAWDNHWSLLDGDGVKYWFDSYLAAEGEQQARDLSLFYATLFTRDGAPLPQTVYTSPLVRCLQTTDIAYRAVLPPPFRATIKENLRERWTLHTCDKRRTKTWIADNWGARGYVFEDGFRELDRLGADGSPSEEDADHLKRKQAALDDIWEGDEGEFLLLVCHSIAIRTVQMLVGSAQFRVKEGSSMALLIKGEKL